MKNRSVSKTGKVTDFFSFNDDFKSAKTPKKHRMNPSQPKRLRAREWRDIDEDFDED